MKREDLAWAAGIFEGEGYIVCGEYKNGDYRSVTVRVGLHMTDKDIIDRFADVFPFGRRCFRAGRMSAITGEMGKDSWVWQTGNAEHVQAFLAMLWPWLGRRRKTKATETITACQKIWPRGTRPKKGDLGVAA